jgi:uncharacterized membrane protein YfcA
MIVLTGRTYFVLTGMLLVTAALLMVSKRTADIAEARPIHLFPAATVGAVAGLISGLTGVGGGVFPTPMLIAASWAPARDAAALSPPFILRNSVVGLIGVSLAGQTRWTGSRS